MVRVSFHGIYHQLQAQHRAQCGSCSTQGSRLPVTECALPSDSHQFDEVCTRISVSAQSGNINVCDADDIAPVMQRNTEIL